MRITVRPMSKERERRFSHSPVNYNVKVHHDTEAIENKENQENVVTTNNATVTVTSNEEWLAEGER